LRPRNGIEPGGVAAAMGEDLEPALAHALGVDGVRDGHASAVLAASIFHFGTYRISEAKQAMAAAGLPMRQGD
jgi:hypothetical protein